MAKKQKTAAKNGNTKKPNKKVAKLTKATLEELAATGGAIPYPIVKDAMQVL